MFIIPSCLAYSKKTQLSNRLRFEPVTIRTLVLPRIHSTTPLLFRLLLLNISFVNVYDDIVLRHYKTCFTTNDNTIRADAGIYTYKGGEKKATGKKYFEKREHFKQIRKRQIELSIIELYFLCTIYFRYRLLNMKYSSFVHIIRK